MEQDAEGSKTIRSVENAFRVLEELRVRGEAGVTELGDAVGLSKSTVHHYLVTLCEQDFAERTDEGYRLGLRALTYGGAARERQDVFRIGKRSVDRLADATGETARLVVERRGSGLTLYQSTRHDREDVHTHLGTWEDLHSTAAGKAILSVMAPERVKEVLGGRLERHTEHTLADPAALRAELDEIRSRGIAFDDEEHLVGVRCAATALVTQGGERLGAISVSGPTERIDDDRFTDELPQELQNVAGVIEIDAAYTGWIGEQRR